MTKKYIGCYIYVYFRNNKHSMDIGGYDFDSEFCL